MKYHDKTLLQTIKINSLRSFEMKKFGGANHVVKRQLMVQRGRFMAENNKTWLYREFRHSHFEDWISHIRDLPEPFVGEGFT